MSIARAREFILCAALAGALAGCAGNRFSSEPPSGVSLEGAWKLNRNASDDPQKIIDRMRAEAFKRIRRAMSSGPEPMGGERGGKSSGRRGSRDRQGAEGSPDEPAEDEDAQAQHDPGGPHGDPLRNSPMMHVLISNIRRGDFLTVRQTPDRIVLDYGASARTFTPGGHSVVSAEGGVADQTSGWKGKEYVIVIRAQLGPDVIEQYGLSEDGKHLVVKLHLGAGELPKVDLTRVYDPTDEVAPRMLPMID
jgi:hypothetical protein